MRFMRRQLRPTLIARTFCLVLMLFARVTKAADRGCDAVLAPSVDVIQHDAHSVLHYLNILDERSYEQAKQGGGGSITLPIDGVPVTFSGSYNQFNEQRKSLFTKKQFDSTYDESINRLRSWIPPNQIKAWLDCKASQDVLTCRVKFADDTTALLVVAWRPVGNLSGIVSSSTLHGASAPNAPAGMLFSEKKTFDPGFSETLLLTRRPNASTVFVLNVSGYTCDGTIDGPKALPPSPPPPPSLTPAQKLSKLLLSRLWNLRVVYMQNEDPRRLSNTSDDVELKFVPAPGGRFTVWRVRDGGAQGTAAQVTVRSDSSGLWYLEFTREDLGDPASGVNCKRALYGRGALFHLNVDLENGMLSGTVDVARPDQGAPYKCAEAQLVPE
jgi:hypothetical protein